MFVFVKKTFYAPPPAGGVWRWPHNINHLSNSIVVASISQITTTWKYSCDIYPVSYKYAFLSINTWTINRLFTPYIVLVPSSVIKIQVENIFRAQILSTYKMQIKLCSHNYNYANGIQMNNCIALSRTNLYIYIFVLSSCKISFPSTTTVPTVILLWAAV